MLPLPRVGWRQHDAVLPREDRLRVERVLASARVFLAVIAALIVYLDPDDPSLLETTAYGVLLIYAIVAVMALAALKWQPMRVLRWRAGLHVADVAAAAIITVLTRGPGSPFFVFFVFVLLAAAMRWGSGPTVATGAAATTLFLIEGVAASRLSQGEMEVTRFFMRAAYLLAATLVLAQLASTIAMFHTESELLSGLLARVKRGDGFAGTLRDVLNDCLRHTRATHALLVLKDEDTARAYSWRLKASMPPSETLPVLSELSTADEALTGPAMPPGVSIWSTGARRGEMMRLRTLGDTVSTLTVAAGPQERLLAAESARAYTAVRQQVATWDACLFLFDAASSNETSLRFLHRLAGQVAPALHSHYLMARERAHIGDVERARLARELHDGLIQSLIGLEMQLDALRRRAASEPVSAELQTIQARLHDSILDTRDLMSHLKTPRVGRSGLIDELLALVERFRHDTGIDARLICSVDEIDSPTRTAQELARIVQEALVNVRKHAAARHVVVRLGRDAEHWLLSIDDDGRGFSFSGRLSQDELDRQRRGPVVIKERVRAIGGELSVESDPGRGSRLSIVWPIGRRSRTA